MRDHERGCEGRSYTCTCGFDEYTHKTIREYESEIASLRRELSDLHIEKELAGSRALSVSTFTKEY